LSLSLRRFGAGGKPSIAFRGLGDRLTAIVSRRCASDAGLVRWRGIAPQDQALLRSAMARQRFLKARQPKLTAG
jgi:hypothetical protein